LVASLFAKLCKDQLKRATTHSQKRDHSRGLFSIFKVFLG